MVLKNQHHVSTCTGHQATHFFRRILLILSKRRMEWFAFLCLSNNQHDLSVKKLPHSTSAVYCLRNGNSGSFDSLINYDTTTKTDILELKTTLFNIKTKRTFEQFCSKAYWFKKKSNWKVSILNKNRLTISQIRNP